MTIINNRSSLATDPIRNFRFLVRFQKHVEGSDGWKPSATVGFTQVSGLSVATAAIPYREGGYNSTVHQIPGQSQFSPVTMQRGMMIGTPQHWNWMKTMFSTVSGDGVRAADTSFRADVEIAILDHPYVAGGANISETGYSGTMANGGNQDTFGDGAGVAMRVKLYNAWITSLAYSDLNAGDNAFLVEQLTLVHEGMDIRLAEKDISSKVPNFSY